MNTIKMVALIAVAVMSSALFVACSDDGDSGGTIVQDESKLLCVADADCSDGLICDNSGACVGSTDPGQDGCTKDTDCSDGLVCDIASGMCVEQPSDGCKSDADCAEGLICNDGACTDIIPFEDDNLRKAVAKALGKGEKEQVTITECKGLTEIEYHPAWVPDKLPDLWYCEDDPTIKIRSLRGLEYCTNINKLELYCNEIDDAGLVPIAGLTKLTHIDFWLNKISDITPLANLTQLTNIILVANQIKKIEALSGLTGLVELRLSYNMISDVSPLKNLGPQPDGKKGLQTLYLDNQSDEKEKKPLSDISSLKGLTGLNHLHLNYNNIKNINVIVHLINLIHLDISQNPIQNFMPLVVNSDKGGLGADSIVWMHDVPKDKPFYSYAVKFLEDNRVTVYKN